MKLIAIIIAAGAVTAGAYAQTSEWTIDAKNIDPNNYFGVTVANGMVGIVSSPEPMKVRDVVLNGVYDYYQRGRVSNILKTFNHLNMNLDVDGRRIGQRDISNYQQSLDMKRAVLVTTFDVGDKLSVRHSMIHGDVDRRDHGEERCQSHTDERYRSSQSFGGCTEHIQRDRQAARENTAHDFGR